jgi:hypothetical protein
MKCHYVECSDLSIVILNVVTASAFMLNIVILSLHTHHKNTYFLYAETQYAECR